MKRLTVLFASILVMITLLGTGLHQLQKKETSAENVLTIYNWGDYIDPELIHKFEKKTGYQVVYETFDSNEAMFTKIKQGGTHYDLTIPSDYMLQKMKANHLLVPLDHKKIPNLKNISSQFLDLPFDPGNRYSIPYFWGTLGIVYNDRFVKKGLTFTTWNDLWDKSLKNNIMLIDGAREVMGLALNKNGDSLNSKNKAQLQKAYQSLLTLVPNVKAIVADEMKMYMINEESAVGVTFSGEAKEMMDANEHLHYVIPRDGSNLWFDNMVIPKTAKNKKAAYAFINFMLEPENAAQNAEYIGYSTPNKKALPLLPKEIREDKTFYPPKEITDRLEVYKDLGNYWLNLYNDYFLRFKMQTH